jgi:hypothetical protein
MNPIEHIHIETLYALLLLSLVGLPAWVTTFLAHRSTPVPRPRRRRGPRAKVLTAQQMTRVDAAVASVITAGEPTGNIYGMWCHHCGAKRAQPAEHAQLWPGGAGGWQVLMACGVCESVMVSRPLTREDAELAADMNVALIQDLTRAV